MRMASYAIAALLAFATSVGVATAQTQYPDKPIHVIIPWPAGGIADVVLRAMQEPLQKALGQPIIIENKAGAGGTIGDDAVAKAAPDGYTLLFTSSALNMNVALGRKLPYDADRDFVPVVNVASAPMILVAYPGLGVKTVKDLVAMAKAKPGKLTFASAGNGSPAHFTAEMFRAATGIDVVHVPYRGSPQAMVDQMAGRVDFHFANSVAAIPQVNAGKVVALAVTGSKRLKVAPGIPTMAEAGIADFHASQWEAFLAPRGTPQAIVDRIAAAVDQVLAQPSVVAALEPFAIEVDGKSTPQSFAALMKSDRTMWIKVAKEANIKVE
jgi:tripartite-type tricarboxylate transporter receptor subunit TctC